MNENSHENSRQNSRPSQQLPTKAYVTAVLSFVLVTFGIVVVFFLTVLAFGRELNKLPFWMAEALYITSLVGAPLLGFVSAKQSLKQARRKMDDGNESTR